jgi:hypothetical protein
MSRQPTKSDRPERVSDQPLAKMNNGTAGGKKPDPELGKHGPLVGETGDRPVRENEQKP